MLQEIYKQKKSTHKVSVLIPSYNHENYIRFCLESAIDQTYKDFEIIILDDCSNDQSIEVIKQFISDHPDIDIQFFSHEKNLGGVLTLNHLIEVSESEYVAVLNSDDIWLPSKLLEQVEYLENHQDVAAVFTQAMIASETSKKTYETFSAISEVFSQTNHTRAEWLRKLFFEQNFFCHPSVLIRRKTYNEIGLYDPRFRQLPDYEMWIRLLKKYEIYIIEKNLVMLRWHENNTSKVSKHNATRGLNELTFILENFFTDFPQDLFMEGFHDYFRNPESRSQSEIICEQTFVYFNAKSDLISLFAKIGLEKLFHLFENPELQNTLLVSFKFDYDSFFNLSGTYFFDQRLFFLAEGRVHSLGKLISSKLKRDFKDIIALSLFKWPKVYYFVLEIWQFLKGKRSFKDTVASLLNRSPKFYSFLLNVWHFIKGK